MAKKLLTFSIALLSCGTMLADTSVAKDMHVAGLSNKSDLKIRFVDSLGAMRQSKQGKEAGKDLEDKRNKLATGIQKEEQEMAKAVNDFKAKSNTLSDASREKEQKRILKMERDYKSRVEEAELEMKMAMGKVTEQLAKEVEKAVVEIAKKDKLDAVVDTTTGRVIFTADHVNLTPDLVVSMDKSFDLTVAQNKTTKKTVKA